MSTRAAKDSSGLSLKNAKEVFVLANVFEGVREIEISLDNYNLKVYLNLLN